MPPTILCIDDQEQGLFVRKMVLQREGYSVLTATNGALGLQLMEQHEEIDAVVLDYRMTGVDGEAVASAIKRRRPDIPIVMLSGYASELPKRALKLVDAVVEKGQTVKALYTALHDVISRVNKPSRHTKKSPKQ
jgi:CheY-like chemotaxis protein